MRYHKKDYDSSWEIFLEDKLLSKDRDKFNKIIQDFTNSEKSNLIINFEHTTELDTGGLGILLFALQKTTDASKKLLLKNPKDAVKLSLKMLKFDTLFEIEFTD